MDVSAIWDVPDSTVIAPLERGGYNNTLYGVSIDGQMPYVLRVYGNHANPRFIQHELTVLLKLQQRGLPFAIPAPIPTRRNELWGLQQDGRARKLMVLLPFIPGLNPEVNNIEQAEHAGVALAHLLIGLAGVEIRGLESPRPYAELNKVHPLVPDPFEAMRTLGSLVNNGTKARVNAVLESIYDDTKRFAKSLPQQLTHGDFINGNILMDGPRVTGVLDFENCTTNPRVMDLAIALDTWSWDVLGTGKEWARIDAIGKGFSSVLRLSQTEIDALPTFILLRNASVLMHLTGRFLSNLTPFVDIEHWIESMLRVDAWLMLSRDTLKRHAAEW